MANWDVTTAGAPLEFDTDNCGWGCPSILMDANHAITFWTSTGKGRAQVFETNTSTWAITTSGAILQFETTNNWFNNACEIDTNHFINFWGGSTGYEGYVQIFEVNTTTWAITTAAASFHFFANGWNHGGCALMDANHVVSLSNYGGAGGGVAQSFAINTSTWVVTTSSATFQFDTGTVNSLEKAILKIDDTHFIAFWGSDTRSDGTAQAFNFNTTTFAITTAGAAFKFETGVTTYGSCPIQIDTTHFLNFREGLNNDGFVEVLSLNTSTWAFTTAGSQLEFDTTFGRNNTCQKIDDNHFINFWSGADSDGFTQMFEVNTTTWAVTTVAPSLEFDTAQATPNASYKIDRNHLVNVWGGTGGDGFTQVFEIEIPPNNYTQELTEFFTITDTTVKAPQKQLIEPVSIIDSTEKQTARTLPENISIADALTKKPNKMLEEQIVISDTFENIKDLNKTLSEIITVIDSETSVVSKSFLETVTLGDAISFLWVLIREYTETVTVSDTFRGVVTARILSETVALSDAFNFFFGKTLSENTVVSDAFLKEVQKEFSENVAISDDISKETGRAFAETVTATDDITKEAGKVFGEAVIISDDITLQTNRVFSEAIQITDDFNIGLFIEISETVTVTDDLLGEITKVMSEIVTINDVVTKLAQPSALLESITIKDHIKNIKDGITVGVWTRTNLSAGTWTRVDLNN